jgi:hypothetical protein
MRKYPAKFLTIGLILCSAAVPVLPGCSRRDGRLAVSGAVTIDDKPLETGSIRFQPVDINKATGSGAIVRNGKYSVPADHGLTPGKYLVTVQASEKTGRMIPNPQDPKKGQVEEFREIHYEEAGKLEIAIDPKASTRFDFPLKRAARPLPAQGVGSRSRK